MRLRPTPFVLPLLHFRLEGVDSVVGGASDLYFSTDSEELVIVEVSFGFDALELLHDIARGLFLHIAQGDLAVALDRRDRSHDSLRHVVLRPLVVCRFERRQLRRLAILTQVELLSQRLELHLVLPAHRVDLHDALASHPVDLLAENFTESICFDVAEGFVRHPRDRGGLLRVLVRHHIRLLNLDVVIAVVDLGRLPVVVGHSDVVDGVFLVLSRLVLEVFVVVSCLHAL